MPTLDVTTEGFDPDVALVVTVTGAPPPARYELRDARSQEIVRMPARMGLAFDPATGSISGTLPSGNGYDALTIVGLDQYGREVARSRSFALYNPPPIPILGGLPGGVTDLFAGVGRTFLLFADGTPWGDASGNYLTGAL